MRKSLLLPVLLLILMTFSCKKDIFHFPYVPIRLELGLLSDLAQLAQGGSFFKEGYGIGGLIIYRDYNDNYYVFDRACTYEKEFSCKVNRYASFEGAVECPCCKSRFLLGETADPIQGPASYPLVRYNAFIEGDLLKIVN